MLFKLAKTYLSCVLALLFLSFFCFTADCAVPSASAAANSEVISLPEVVRQTIAIHFGERKLDGQTFEQFANSLPVKPEYRKPAGVFVTLSYKGKTRACWGSINPTRDNIVKQTVFSTLNALTKEYRYPPIKRAEWKKLKPQVTVIKGVEPISSIAFQNPLRDGLLVRNGGRAGVYLPGEAADAHYQLVQCKLKAGIKSGEPCQLYRLRTDIYD